MTKFFQKCKKNYFWAILGTFWAFFAQIGQKLIFLEKRHLPVFSYSNYLPSCQKSEKNYWVISEKNAELRDR